MSKKAIKKSFPCPYKTCDRTFQSGTALGGHVSKHRKDAKRAIGSAIVDNKWHKTQEAKISDCRAGYDDEELRSAWFENAKPENKQKATFTTFDVVCVALISILITILVF